MNWRAVRTLIYKDLRVVSKSRAVLLPMILVPLIIVIVIPIVFGATITNAVPSSSDITDLQSLLGNVPPEVWTAFGTLDAIQQTLIYMLIYFFAPLFLILPLMVASVIAADSFAGERERKTLEALVYTPTSDAELFVGKVLAPWLASFVVTLLAFFAYAIIVNILGAPFIGHIFFPDLMWLILVFWVSPAAAGLGLSTMVLVSARVNTFQEAYQMGSLVVLPILLLLFGQMAGVIFLSPAFVLVVGLVIWLLDFGLLWIGARSFARSKLLARL
jgi:ABC-type Na+ efflux pump permease subunit